MDAEHMVCPYCHRNVREAGVVKVETGMTQHTLYDYHPLAQQFMEDLSRREHGAATTWQCRSCKRDLGSEIAAYIESHVERY
jgi:hypothetical protein